MSGIKRTRKIMEGSSKPKDGTQNSQHENIIGMNHGEGSNTMPSNPHTSLPQMGMQAPFNVTNNDGYRGFRRNSDRGCGIHVGQLIQNGPNQGPANYYLRSNGEGASTPLIVNAENNYASMTPDPRTPGWGLVLNRANGYHTTPTIGNMNATFDECESFLKVSKDEELGGGVSSNNPAQSKGIMNQPGVPRTDGVDQNSINHPNAPYRPLPPDDLRRVLENDPAQAPGNAVPVPMVDSISQQFGNLSMDGPSPVQSSTSHNRGQGGPLQQQFSPQSNGQAGGIFCSHATYADHNGNPIHRYMNHPINFETPQEWATYDRDRYRNLRGGDYKDMKANAYYYESTDTYTSPPKMWVYEPKNDHEANHGVYEIVSNAIVIKNIEFGYHKDFLKQQVRERVYRYGGGIELPESMPFNYHFNNGKFTGVAFANLVDHATARRVRDVVTGVVIRGRDLRVEFKKVEDKKEKEKHEQERAQNRGQSIEQHSRPKTQEEIRQEVQQSMYSPSSSEALVDNHTFGSQRQLGQGPGYSSHLPAGFFENSASTNFFPPSATLTPGSGISTPSAPRGAPSGPASKSS